MKCKMCGEDIHKNIKLGVYIKPNQFYAEAEMQL